MINKIKEVPVTYKNQVFRLAVLSAAVLLIVFSWHTFFQNAKLRHRLADLMRAREFPHVLTGLRLDILKETTLLEKWPTQPDIGPAQKKLLLVASDTCSPSKRNIPNWRTLLSTLPPDRSQEVWLLTFNTHKSTAPLTQELRKRNIPYRVLLIADPIIFSLKTGIVGTPMTLVLDQNSSVGLVCYGQLGGREIEAFRAYLVTAARPGKIFLTSFDRRTTDIQSQ